MDFKQITLSDVGALRPYLRAQYRSCDYSVLGVFMWADRFGYEYKTEDGVLFMRERSRHGGEYDYLLPLGEGSLCDRVRALRETVAGRLPRKDDANDLSEGSSDGSSKDSSEKRRG